MWAQGDGGQTGAGGKLEGVTGAQKETDELHYSPENRRGDKTWSPIKACGGSGKHTPKAMLCQTAVPARRLSSRL